MKIKKYIKFLLNIVRVMYWSNKLGSIQRNVSMEGKITFKHPECLYIGENVHIGKYSYFLPCTNYAGIKYKPKIIIGSDCYIGIRNSFACIDRIEIGKNVLFAGYVHITDHSHGYENVELPIKGQRLVSKGPVVIEDNCWLGFNSEILSGVHIGKNCIVGARAVVTKNVPPFCVVAGNPAKVIKKYNFETCKWENVQ